MRTRSREWGSLAHRAASGMSQQQHPPILGATGSDVSASGETYPPPPSTSLPYPPVTTSSYPPPQQQPPPVSYMYG